MRDRDATLLPRTLNRIPVTQAPEPGIERRRNVLLRMLVNEMLDQVRDLQRHAGPWQEDEREQAERALERIMTQVRSEAVRRHGE